MNIHVLDSLKDLEKIRTADGPSVIFKHNTTCPISKNTKANFEKNIELLPKETSVYILDLLTYREVSDAIEKTFSVKHESPQLLVIKSGKCIFHQSLYDISAEDAADALCQV